MTVITSWTEATASLTATQQRVILDTLNLVQSGDIKIVYGVNTLGGRPCLINAIGEMIKEVDYSPSYAFGHLVMAFDEVCDEISHSNKAFGYVTDLMAEVLVRHFGKLKDLPIHLIELPDDFKVPDYYDADVQG